jgi:TonB family protein
MLSAKEKHQILQHERVHAQRVHSFDILLLNILGIFFWFNPVLIIYKKIFVQLHEFEADARAVTNHDVNDYCSLLARVALLSADIKLANHFNNSLTLKRIQMMRTMKSKIHGWKIAAMALVIPLFFVVIACQEQVMNEVSEVAKSSSMALDVPGEVQAKYDALVKAKPDKKLLLIEMDQHGQAKLEEMRLKMENLKPNEIASIEIIKIPAAGTDPARAFAIVEYSEMMNKISDLSSTDEVFTVVEESATPKIGMEAFYKYIMQNLRYPLEARTKGVEGKVFIQFIVQKDGTLTDFTVLKSVDPALDNEAIRVLQGASEWNPGKQAGVIVKQKVVMPINFRINGSDLADKTENPEGSLSEVVAVGRKNN